MLAEAATKLLNTLSNFLCVLLFFDQFLCHILDLCICGIRYYFLYCYIQLKTIYSKLIMSRITSALIKKEKRILSRCMKFINKDYLAEYAKEEKKNKSVLDNLRAKIETTGPITVADYMKLALVSPSTGYYMSRDVFGAKGDFITSPEVSQIFGELIAIWFLKEWTRIGRPQPLQLVELGPGRGTLTDDILRVISKLESQIDLSVHFVEISPHLCQVQMEKLCVKSVPGDPYGRTTTTRHGYPLTWYPHLSAVPEGFSLFLAHEFFDAMPIHKLQKTENGWREILIDFKDGELQYVISRNPTPASKLFVDENEKRDHVEISPESGVLLDDIIKRMTRDGGISLIVDYGHLGTKTDTFRSFKEHKLCDPLSNPGVADLTADVDFQYLKKQAEGKAVVFGPITQAEFLTNMCIDFRFQMLLHNASSENKDSIRSGYEMLSSSNKMGERFKFLALFPKVLERYLTMHPPAGFQILNKKFS